MKKKIEELIAFATKEKHFVSYESDDKLHYVITLSRMIYSKEMRLLDGLDCMICIGDGEVDILIFKN